MENPNAGVNLRRHNSLPVRRRPKFFHRKNYLPQKSNPYVGWFRHSPPITSSFCTGKERPQPETIRLRFGHLQKQASSNDCYHQKSPYVGWFRHAPPSCHQFLAEYLAKELSFLPAMDCHGLLRLTDLLSGHLAGGKPGIGDSNNSSGPLWSSMPSSSSLAALIFRRVAYWLQEVVPSSKSDRFWADVIYDDGTKKIGQEVSSPDRDDGYDSSDDDDDSIMSRCDSMDHEIEPRRRSSSVSSSTMVSSQAEAYYAHTTVTSSITTKRVLQDCSVYDDDDDEGGHRDSSRSLPRTTTTGLGRLDYDITQMDILRMTRNASRHLDVESILRLPTITYHHVAATTTSPRRNQETAAKKVPNSEEEIQEGSWMFILSEDEQCGSEADDDSVMTIIPPLHAKDSDGRTAHNHAQVGAAAGIQANQDVTTTEDHNCACVICLEQFVEGDRLRVLHCGHSFHMGCIDRWLSGSHSFSECYTTGCPICKKQPNQENNSTTNVGGNFLWWQREHQQTESSCLDGSVPSWVFDRIGFVLARESLHLTNDV
jgi:hypothetical protein